MTRKKLIFVTRCLGIICCRGFTKILVDATKKMDHGIIIVICNAIETKISKNIKVYFISRIKLMKNYMVPEIMRDIVGVPRNVSTKDVYKEATKDFEFIRSSCEDRTNPVEYL